MKAWIVIVFALCLAPLPALAETGQADCRPGEDCTIYEFPPDVVDGDVATGEGGPIYVAPRHGTVSLLRVRTHFVPELVKSVENI